MLKGITAVLVCAVLAVAADVTGTWQVKVTTSMGSGAPTLDLKQQGEQLTGTLHSAILGDVAVKGQVKGDQVEFSGEGDASGQKVKLTYKGTIKSATAMEGTAVYEGIDDTATWTAARK
jgi:hypothetical protein